MLLVVMRRWGGMNSNVLLYFEIVYWITWEGAAIASFGEIAVGLSGVGRNGFGAWGNGWNFKAAWNFLRRKKVVVGMSILGNSSNSLTEHERRYRSRLPMGTP